MWFIELAKTLAPVAGLAASCWTLINTGKILWLARKREKLENERITIVISCPEVDVVLDYKPQRKTLSRAELLGILGMHSSGGRFTLSKLPKVFTSGQFDRIMSGEESVLRIEASEAEAVFFCVNTSISEE